MKKNITFILLSITNLFFAQIKNSTNMNKEFIVVHSNEIDKNKLKNFELVDFGVMRSQTAPIGDFLSRMWGNFGKPEGILYEGFNYYIKDKKTDITFIVYFGAGGPAYASHKDDIEKVKLIIKDFENLLEHSKNADCEIEVETDYGIYLSGAKNGIPYDTQK